MIVHVCAGIEIYHLALLFLLFYHPEIYLAKIRFNNALNQVNVGGNTYMAAPRKVRNRGYDTPVHIHI